MSTIHDYPIYKFDFIIHSHRQEITEKIVINCKILNCKNWWTRWKSKTLLVILKTLLINKKIYFISPILQDNRYITDFKKKAELFNLFFAKQCSKIDNSSKLHWNFLKKTDKSISTITFSCDDIARFFIAINVRQKAFCS